MSCVRADSLDAGRGEEGLDVAAAVAKHPHGLLAHVAVR